MTQNAPGFHYNGCDRVRCDRASFQSCNLNRTASGTGLMFNLLNALGKDEMTNQSTCPFCKADATRIILGNANCIAFYDGFPVSPGHFQIVPKCHITSFFEATSQEQVAMFDLLAEMRQLLLNPPPTPLRQSGEFFCTRRHQRRHGCRPDGHAPAHPPDPALSRRHGSPARRGTQVMAVKASYRKKH